MADSFVHTDTILDKILANTAQEVAARKAAVPQAGLERAAAAMPPARDMLAALRRETVALIAEVKHASPSRGVLVEPFDPAALARAYAENGAAAISVLTDTAFFQGSLEDLRAVRGVVDVPVLRKDFLLDAYQVYEARAAGADCVLLIVAALPDGLLADLHALATELGLAALVEVHNAAELERALRLKPRLLGINNRDLKTFNVSLETFATLAAQVPDGITLVAESGIFSGADAAQMGRLGAHAVLVGEALVKAPDTPALVRELSRQPREIRSG